MIKKAELRFGNLLNFIEEGNTCDIITNIKTLKWLQDDPEDFNSKHEPIELTKEIFKELGFEVTDMGDYWEYQKENFYLIQVKIPILDKLTSPMFVLNSEKSSHLKVKYVHRLQNLYYEIKNEELIYIKNEKNT
jgi:hypothetical protein